MKTYKSKAYFTKVCCGCMLLFPIFGNIACTEEIDDSNFAIKTHQTAADYIDTNEDLSMISTLLKRVRLGDIEGASTLYNVLTARGNYTLFLPTNSAVQQFMDENEIASIENFNDEQAGLITKSCIIDNDEDPAYETADLPVKGSLSLPNLNDRLLSCHLNEDAEYIINGNSKITDEDHEVSNGFIHIVDHVIAPSALTLDKQIATADNMKVFSYLLQKTTWCDSLLENLDKSYEDPNRVLKEKHGQFVYYNARHRYIGYTALIEPDSIYEKALDFKVQLDNEGNLTNGEEILQKVTQKAQEVYGTKATEDLSHPDNAVNQFVAYHLLEGKMPFNRLIYHYNEYNYKFGDCLAPQLVNMPTNVWEFYPTLGQHRSIVKVTQVGDAGFEQDLDHKVYINRISTYANGPEEDYHETGVVDGYEGILVESNNGNNDNNALNGYYFPINQLLLYTNGFRDELYKRRLRIDTATMLPELVTNNFRACTRTCFDNNFFENVPRITNNTQIVYGQVLTNESWGDLWGDCVRVFGLYDFTLKLPPVPKDGTYEIRMGNSHGYIRGMVQLYFGDDPDNLMPAGLPYDMRAAPEETNPEIPWIKDGDDWVTNFENDKFMKNQGYMKGPQYFTECTGHADSPCRGRGGRWGVIRKIVTTADLKADKTYYMRFKSALKKYDAELALDYFEFASTAVYNGAKPEDIW